MPSPCLPPPISRLGSQPGRGPGTSVPRTDRVGDDERREVRVDKGPATPQSKLQQSIYGFVALYQRCLHKMPLQPSRLVLSRQNVSPSV